MPALKRTPRTQSGQILISSLLALTGFVGMLALVMNSWSPILDEQLAADTTQAKNELIHFSTLVMDVSSNDAIGPVALERLTKDCKTIPERQHYYSTRVEAGLRTGFDDVARLCQQVAHLEKTGTLNQATFHSLVAPKETNTVPVNIARAVKTSNQQ